MSLLLFLKSLHIFGFVAWFAGLFYLVRIFVYDVEAAAKSEPERSILQSNFRQMEWRVYKIICNPAMMITWTAGIGMLVWHGMDWFKINGWMHIKLLLLIGLTVYHVYCKRIIKRFEAGENPFTSFQFRLLNELPTLFLLSIVLLAVYRNTLNFIYAFGGVLLFGVLLYVIAKAYKRSREGAEAKLNTPS